MRYWWFLFLYIYIVEQIFSLSFGVAFLPRAKTSRIFARELQLSKHQCNKNLHDIITALARTVDITFCPWHYLFDTRYDLVHACRKGSQTFTSNANLFACHKTNSRIRQEARIDWRIFASAIKDLSITVYFYFFFFLLFAINRFIFKSSFWLFVFTWWWIFYQIATYFCRSIVQYDWWLILLKNRVSIKMTKETKNVFARLCQIFVYFRATKVCALTNNFVD